MITGAREADQVTTELKARNARVIYNLNFPTRSRALPPDADEPLRQMRATPELASMRVLASGNRLSITPVSAAEWRAVQRLLKP